MHFFSPGGTSVFRRLPSSLSRQTACAWPASCCAGRRGCTEKLLTRFDYIGLPSEEVLQYVLENRLSPKPEVCLSVPFTFFEGRPFPPAREEITITVPGAITGNGRDYAMLLECFGKVLPGIEEKVRLILLGMPKGRYGRDIQREFKALQSDNFRVETFSGPVPQRDFDAFLESTDFVILPLLPRRRFSIFVEKTGYSNRTGGVNDIIRFGIPALLPSFYPLAPQGKNLSVSLTHPLQIPKTSSPLLHFSTSPLFKNVAQICERYHDAEDLSAKLLTGSKISATFRSGKKRRLRLVTTKEIKLPTNFSANQLFDLIVIMIDGFSLVTIPNHNHADLKDSLGKASPRDNLQSQPLSSRYPGNERRAAIARGWD
jgi:hypothetical protein